MSVYPTVPKLVTVREIDLRQRRTSIVQEKEHRIHLYMKVSLVMNHWLTFIWFLGFSSCSFFCQKSSNMVKIGDKTCSICLRPISSWHWKFFEMSGFRHLSTTIALLVIQSYCNKCHRSKFLFDRLYSGLVLVIHTTLPRTLWCWEIPVFLTTRVWNNIFWCQWIRKQLHFTVDITKISINIFLIQNSGLRIYSGSVLLFWETFNICSASFLLSFTDMDIQYLHSTSLNWFAKLLSLVFS